MSDFNYQQLDDLIHSRIRLAIMAALASLETTSFKQLKQAVGATDGNLSIHLKKLEDAEYITVEKTFIDRKPISIYALCPKGREAFNAYIQYLETILPTN
jgi:DNA-binding MarR family transcriptional regulator